MKKVEVLVSALKIKLKGDKDPVILDRGDHVAENRIDASSLEIMFKNKMVKSIGGSEKAKTTTPKKETAKQTEETAPEKEPETDVVAGGEPGEF